MVGQIWPKAGHIYAAVDSWCLGNGGRLKKNSRLLFANKMNIFFQALISQLLKLCT